MSKFYVPIFFVSIALMLLTKLKTLGEVKSCLAITFAWPLNHLLMETTETQVELLTDYFLFNSWFKSNISVAIAHEREHLNVIAHLY